MVCVGTICLWGGSDVGENPGGEISRGVELVRITHNHATYLSRLSPRS